LDRQRALNREKINPPVQGSHALRHGFRLKKGGEREVTACSVAHKQSRWSWLRHEGSS
jgi:hypothetical protein